MTPSRIDVTHGAGTYAVLVGAGLTRRLPSLLSEHGLIAETVVVTCPPVWRAHEAWLQPALGSHKPLIMPDGERAKTLPTVARLYEGGFAEAREDARTAARLFAEAGDPVRAQGAQVLEVDAAASASLFDEAREVVAELLAAPLSDGRRARVLAARARLQGGAGEFESGAGDADGWPRVHGTTIAQAVRNGCRRGSAAPPPPAAPGRRRPPRRSPAPRLPDR